MRDRYTISERLDHGGMAEVFRGVAESMEGFKRPVAIKRILPNLTKNQKFVSMFLDEARLSLLLQHANIVQVFDISKTPDNAYFLVMEYVDGCNLKALIERQKQKGKRIEVAHSIYLMIECCKALQYAHALEHPETNEALGIVHRDISPPNILLSKNGEVKLVDFGLAKANSQIESTDPGVVKGKFSYLSPEAASGQDVDFRADVFAAGIILWELFTGRRLFYGETDYQTVELVRQARVPSIAALNPEVDAELEQVVRKALARNPDDRYQSAGDLGDALAQFLFSHRMKVTARDISSLVRDTQVEMMRKRSAEAKGKDSLIDALILDEMQKMTSLIDGKGGPQSQVTEGSTALDASAFVDTSAWAGEMGPGGAGTPPPRPMRTPRPNAPARGRDSSLNNPAPGDIESLEQMLEPDRTGVHKAGDKKTPWLLILVVLVLIAAGAAAVAMFVLKR
ncbi:MAG TPA: serine/threonine-protein kinase [Kofleriaceae bacterium]|nr:serine/threonine-protein kinase [Kofleriaceae bacterium]